MTAKVQLLGPPRLHHQNPSSTTVENHDSVSDHVVNLISSPSMDLIVDSFDTMNLPSTDQPLMGRTENFSATFLTSGNPCIDFFFHIVPDTPSESVIQRLELAWKHNPLTTLKLVCNLRGVRGTGKSDKEGFYASALWIHQNHPKTLAGNLKWFAEFGYFKDLPEILFRLIEGLDVRKMAREERPRKKRRGWNTKRMRRSNDGDEEIDVKKSRKEKKIEKGKKALEMYCNDEDYQFLHDRISDLFAEYLISDLKLLNSGEIKQISLASKWCPNLDSSFDRATLLCESIAKRVFPREDYPEYQGIEEAHYAYRVRDRLRKQYLVPLHQALEIPEVYICSKRWDSLPYNRVPSIAMRNYKGFFEKHDEERFKEYLEKVKTGKATIAAGALLPHEIIASVQPVNEDDDDKDKNDVAELQWRRMVKDITEKGKLRDCLAVCDVSGSMYGTPMEVCVALGLLVSEMSEEPWKGKVITFSENPQLHTIAGDDLYSKIISIRDMDWGGSTDFQKVFDQILQVAIDGKLSADKMIKRLFVFSDMEFDEASGSGHYQYDSDASETSASIWETDYEVIKRKFQEAGYENSVPEIVFWNLRDSSSTPVMGEQKGVALVSGFSKNVLTLFLDGMENMNPTSVMEMAVSGEEYQQLVVID